MHVKEGSRPYSLGQRRLPAPRHRSVRRKGGVSRYLALLFQALAAVAGARRAIAVASLPLILLAAMVAAFNLPLLKIAQVEIVGARTLDVSRARASLRLEGNNILSIDAPMIEKVLRQQPAVKEVSVKRQWPNKVLIQVEERRPIALWQTPGGAFAVDEEGYVLSEATPGPLPAIVAQEGGVRVGSRVPRGTLELSRQLFARMEKEVDAPPHQFQYSASQGLSVVTDLGWTAVFGDERDLNFKLATLAAALRVARERKIGFQYVDLRYGERPFLR